MKPWREMTEQELHDVINRHSRHKETLGGDLLDDEGNATGHKLRHMNEAIMLNAMSARDELNRRGSNLQMPKL